MQPYTSLAIILHQAGLISQDQEQAILNRVEQEKQPVPAAVLALGIMTPNTLSEHISQIFHMPLTEPEQFDYTNVCRKLGLGDLVLQHMALPVKLSDTTVTIAVCDPANPQTEADFCFATGLAAELVLTDVKTLSAAIRRLYGKQTPHPPEHSGKAISEDELASLVDVSADEAEVSEDLSRDNAPVSRFIHQVLLDAVRRGASDIHFEPYEDRYRIRLRCDGILVETQQPASHLARRLTARLKILSGLDIAERRLPQDGRLKLRLDSETAVDMRVSTLPALWGEKVVLRLLDSSVTTLNIHTLGYSSQQKTLYLNALNRPQGMILVTGPTGSGKTVSLYTGLSLLNTPERNISTAEDPVEINLSGVNQVQISSKIGFGFTEALRTFLRQDPDVVMVGEIRDPDTAAIAVQAAQTGHLVLSTLHTNSAAETVIRLQNMGIMPFNLASSLSLIIAQRLARCLCPHCKQPDTLTPVQAEDLNIHQEERLYRANKSGCAECTGGYCGRTGIYEVMPFDNRLAEAVIKGASVKEIEIIAKEQGMKTLRESGIDKLKLGITSYEELQRVLAL